MDNKNLFISVLRIVISWPVVVAVLGFRIIDLFSPRIVTFSNISLSSNSIWEIISSLGVVVTAIIAGCALSATKRAGLFDKTPNVIASGTFIISKEVNANKSRDKEIDEKTSIHTLQLINLGRGMAKSVIPSIIKIKEGRFLEDVCPHSFNLSSGKSTRELGEILRVHGQRFKDGKKGDVIEIKTEKENREENKIGYFYIYFEDFYGTRYKTKVKIQKVKNIDNSIKNGRIEELINTTNIEIWKVMENTKENI